jgi:hypothetical protein
MSVPPSTGTGTGTETETGPRTGEWGMGTCIDRHVPNGNPMIEDSPQSYTVYREALAATKFRDNRDMGNWSSGFKACNVKLDTRQISSQSREPRRRSLASPVLPNLGICL